MLKVVWDTVSGHTLLWGRDLGPVERRRWVLCDLVSTFNPQAPSRLGWCQQL